MVKAELSEATLESLADHAARGYWQHTHPWGVSARPEIVTLCGSTRFVDEFNEWRKRLTLRGQIVLSIEIVTSQQRDEDPQHVDPSIKSMLDVLHLFKIGMSDYIFVLNKGSYIGESTAKEIEYARRLGKPVEYLEAPR